tara:strand:- start:76 stop:228 length:153 start_codon:yes stop_codon:yes gene_type:complete
MFSKSPKGLIRPRYWSKIIKAIFLSPANKRLVAALISQSSTWDENITSLL